MDVNVFGIQHVHKDMRDAVFGGPENDRKPDPRKIHLAKNHLDHHGLLGKKTNIQDPIKFPLPKLEGKTLDEHFYRLGTDVAEPYRTMAFDFIQNSLPPKPTMDEWDINTSGWVRYEQGKSPQKVDYPLEDKLVFDVEVLYKISDYPVIATAASPNAWYGWISPWLLSETEEIDQLIPLGPRDKHRVIVGHNVGYDRKRVKEEYHIEESKNFFLDTMSLHIAVNGMCSRQRPQWMKLNKRKKAKPAEEEQEDGGVERSLSPTGRPGEDTTLTEDLEDNPWFQQSALNNLADVSYLHCGIKLDKSTRDYFGELSRKETVDNLAMLLDYCAEDVNVTHKVLCKVLPLFIDVCPHPVSFAGFKEMSSLFLPINRDWDSYLDTAEQCFQDAHDEINGKLVELTDKAVALKDKPEIYLNDPWLSQLDWTITPIRMKKAKKDGTPPEPAAGQKHPGMPNWYKKLFPRANSPMNITVKSRITPLLLRLQWDGHPLIWTTQFGWIFKCTPEEARKYQKLNYGVCDMSKQEPHLRDDIEHVYFKVPHKDGPTARCTSPMAKGYMSYFEQGILFSEYEHAKLAIELNSQCSYWGSARERLFNQMPVYSNTTDMGVPKTSENGGKEFGMIIPKTIPMGTITRRAVEDTWLTASNAKKNRIGSELKAMVKAPPGYVFIGADVDSEELWIASLIGDSLFGMHGSTALGWMTLEGTKNEGTDLHSRTASILGISRNEAKIFNYGRIYGAGLKFATMLLRQFNPLISNEEASSTAMKLYKATKGESTKSSAFKMKQFWRGGSESVVFNRLEEMAEEDSPQTPVLGASITAALTRQNLGKSNFLPSRINWSIQSSGVDYLHLLTVSMNYLLRRYKIQGRLCITVHDEIRYLVKEEDRYRAALALQISNLWTRAMFCQQLGIDNVPQSCAFFSLIDIDHVMRKEVDMDCVTVSNPDPIPTGEALDINQLLEQCPKLLKPRLSSKEQKRFKQLQDIPYTPRTSVFDQFGKKGEETPFEFLESQLEPDKEKFKEIEKHLTRQRKNNSRKQNVVKTENDNTTNSKTKSDHSSSKKAKTTDVKGKARKLTNNKKKNILTPKSELLTSVPGTLDEGFVSRLKVRGDPEVVNFFDSEWKLEDSTMVWKQPQRLQYINIRNYHGLF